MTHILVSAIKAYQRFISPMKQPSCRFHPTCSNYSIGSLEKHGIVKGLFLAAKRILRCHPFHPGGYDPVK
ncbi:MAG: membrane protein insertion efficiency factor YidD [Deltaproteobacteria bacterium GWA2_47_9]|nr:MAG: membrane protein insertion efficiency factor YidD [Deltaproteobacteria bacterium GWA2_47_9]